LLTTANGDRHAPTIARKPAATRRPHRLCPLYKEIPITSVKTCVAKAFRYAYECIRSQCSWRQRQTTTKRFTLRLSVCAAQPLGMQTLTSTVADLKSLHLPKIPIPKPGIRRTLRRLYAVCSIEDVSYEMSSLDPEAYMTRPLSL
jgi:hypothetical protein